MLRQMVFGVTGAMVVLASLAGRLVALEGRAATPEAAAIDGLMRRYHDLGEFNGTVLVARRGAVVVNNGYGDADVVHHVPNTAGTKFLIGSVSKQFTAVVVLKLIEEGRLRFDSRLSDVLPYYRKDTGGKITIRHLLDHTAGIAPFRALSDIDRSSLSTEDFVKAHCSGDLQFEPGTRFAYSNVGYIVLGAVVERVTRQPYAAALREYVLDPLSMKDTGMARQADIAPPLARGYQRRGGVIVDAPPVDPFIAFSAGGLHSTTGDLLRWEKVFYGGRVLDASSRALLRAPTSSAYTCGLRFDRRPIGPAHSERDVVYHGGRIEGFNSLLLRVPADRLLIVLMNNTDSTRLETMAGDILEILYGRTPRTPRRSLAEELRVAARTASMSDAVNVVRRLRSGEDGLGDPDPEELQLNELGYEQMRAKRPDAAAAVFAFAVEVFPKSWNAYDSLAEAQAAAGQIDRAISSYTKSLELNPGNRNAAEQIARLKGQR